MRAIIDKKQVAANRSRAERLGIAGADFLLERALDELDDRLAVTNRSFTDAIAIGWHGRRISERLARSGKVQSCRLAQFDEQEHLDASPNSADLAVSLLDLHELDDVPGALIQISQTLRPDGLLLACMPSSGTLAELRESLTEAEMLSHGGVSPRLLPLIDVRDAGALLQRAGFALPVADHESVTVRYQDPFALMRDLRAMGATNTLIARSRTPASRAFFAAAAQHYLDNQSDPDGRIRATFAFVWLSGWAPDPGQPKPLKPGSATRSLAKELKDKS